MAMTKEARLRVGINRAVAALTRNPPNSTRALFVLRAALNDAYYQEILDYAHKIAQSKPPDAIGVAVFGYPPQLTSTKLH